MDVLAKDVPLKDALADVPGKSTPQFSLQGLLILIAVFACAAAFWRFLSALPGWGHVVLDRCGWPILLLNVLPLCIAAAGIRKRSDWPQFAQTFSTIALTELLFVGFLLATYLAIGFESLGYFFLAIAMMVPCLLCASGRWQASIAWTVVLAIQIFVSMVALQIESIVRLHTMGNEAREMARYCDAFRLAQGIYPPDLSGYKSSREELRPLIRYWSPADLREDNYILSFHVSDHDNTVREYSPRKGWWYFDD